MTSEEEMFRPRASSSNVELSMEESWIKEVKEWVCELLSSPQQFDLPSNFPLSDSDINMLMGLEGNLEFPKPTMVTIGPYYHYYYEDKSSFRKHCLRPEEDDRKLLITYMMTRLYELNLKGCLEKIKTLISTHSFHKFSTFLMVFCSEEDKKKKLIVTLLLDSCFILFMLTSSEIQYRVTAGRFPELFRLYYSKGLEIMPDRLNMPRVANILSHKDKIMLDLLLFNNQIPFPVIEELFKELGLKKPLYKFALEFFETIHPNSMQGRKGKNNPPEFLNLLHLFHWSRVPENKYAATTPRNPLDSIDWPRYIPTAIELREHATIFHKKTSGSALDITFRSGRLISIFGVLRIPHLHIDDYSSSIFHSLITFEKEFPSQNQSYCTMVYSAFMRSLLQSEEDVKLLRRHGILTSMSMTDSEVVNCFKCLSELTDYSEMPIDLFAIYRQILSHHNRHMGQFWGSIILQYFPNPLVTFSVFAAVILFILTFLQTLYTMLAYYYRH